VRHPKYVKNKGLGSWLKWYSTLQQVQGSEFKLQYCQQNKTKQNYLENLGPQNFLMGNCQNCQNICMCAHISSVASSLGFLFWTSIYSIAYVSASLKEDLKRRKTPFKTHRCKRLLKNNQWHITDNWIDIHILRISGHKGKVIESDDFYLFDCKFKFSTGLKQCLSHSTVTRGTIDLGIREELMQLLKSGFTEF
jgi:hypothetical protein